MKEIVHARLDEETRKVLRRLQRRHGWSDSDIVRLGIRALAEAELPQVDGVQRIHGVGKFSSGVNDLASNKKHLRDFGR